MINKQIEKSNNTRIRNSTVAYLDTFRWEYFITLNFISMRSEFRARKIIDRFLKSLNASVYGKKSNKAVIVAVSLEKHKEGGLHAHIVTENPIKRINNIERKNKLNFKELVKTCWEETDSATGKIDISCKDKESWFKLIYEQNGVLFYITKEMTNKRLDTIQWELTNPTGKRFHA